MSDRTPRLETFVEDLVEGRLADVHTCIPAEVVEFDAAANKITAQPLIKVSLIDDDGETVEEELPAIPDVPVAYIRGAGGKFSLVFPLEAGDLVTLIFAERSIDRWLAGDGAAANPGDLRKHQLSDAVAWPGTYPFSKAEGEPAVESDRMRIQFGPDTRIEAYEDKILIELNGTLICVKDGLIELGEEGSGDKASLDSEVQNNLAEISTQLNNLVNDFNSHTHPLPDMLYPLIPLPGPPIPTLPGLAPSPPTMAPVVPSTVSYTETPTESSLVTIKE